MTAERIRDKIAASKARGMWMGGTPPIGYRPDGRSLAIVEENAAIVRHIFERYSALANVRQLANELEEQGIRSPARLTANGRAFDGRPFSRGQLYKMLSNAIYIGRIEHGNRTHQGNHAPILPSGSAAVAKVDRTLVRAIVRGRDWWHELQADTNLTLASIGKREGVTSGYVVRIVRLAFLSPEILAAVVDSKASAHLSIASLTMADGISPRWEDQRHSLGARSRA